MDKLLHDCTCPKGDHWFISRVLCFHFCQGESSKGKLCSWKYGGTKKCGKGQEVIQQLNLLNIHKPAGPDSLHPMIIKTLGANENFVNTITVLFQAVTSTHCIPNPWKRAIVTALHKKGPLNDVCNYRPISLTFILCKVFEILLYRHLYTHVRDNLSLHQHGFNHGKWSLSNLLETVHEINAILENGEVVDLVY